MKIYQLSLTRYFHKAINKKLFFVHIALHKAPTPSVCSFDRGGTWGSSPARHPLTRHAVTRHMVTPNARWHDTRWHRTPGRRHLGTGRCVKHCWADRPGQSMERNRHRQGQFRWLQWDLISCLNYRAVSQTLCSLQKELEQLVQF